MTHSLPRVSASILIVDDDADICIALIDLLTEEGHRVETVETGSAALRLLQRLSTDVVILDVGLPDMDGLTVLQAIRERHPHLPVILLTVHNTLERSHGPMDLQGAFAYLIKPYDREELKATVRKALRLSALATRIEQVQRALGGSEIRFWGVIESAPDAIVLANQHGTITNWNRAAAEQFGYTEDEVLGKPLTILMPPRYRDAHHHALSRFISVEHSRLIGKTLELEGLRKDGTSFPIELSLGSWQTDEGIAFSGFIRDIGQRKRIEQELQRRTALERSIASICRQFLRASIEEIDSEIPAALGTIGEMMAIDRASVFLFSENTDVITNPYTWASSNVVHNTLDSLPRHPWLTDRIIHEATVHWPTLAAVPPEASEEQALFRTDCIQSLIAVPLIGVDKVWGYFRLDSIRHPREWGEHDQRMLAIVGEILVTALERKRLELVHRDNEERFRRLVETMNVLPWEAEYPSNRITYIGPQARAMFGYDPEDWYRDRFWEDHIHPDDRNRVLHICHDAARRQSEYELEYRMYAADGRIVWVHDFVRVHRDREGHPEVLNGLTIDITKRMQDQKFVQAARQEIGAVLTDLPLPVFILDRNMRVLYANAHAQHVFQRTELFDDTPIQTILPLTAAQWEHLQSNLARLDADDLPHGSQDAFAFRDRTFRYQLFRVALPGHRFYGGGLVLWDVTDFHRLQDQLVQSEKLSGLGMLISGMAHEMSNPLQAILGLTEHLSEETDPDAVREITRDLLRIGKHVSTLLHDFMAYVRPAAHSSAGPIDMNDRLHTAVRMVQRGPYFGHIHVITRFQNIPCITAHRSDIDQILINLITNAAQAMAGDGHLTLSTEATDSAVRVRIEDTGGGIPPETMDKIFEPFFTTKPLGHGTGLGLGIVRQIVRDYHGTLQIESQVDRGTVCTLEFPIDPHSQNAAQPVTAS